MSCPERCYPDNQGRCHNCGDVLGAEVRRMRLVSQEDLEALVALARAAVRYHENVTHYGKCDVCDTVDSPLGRELRRGEIDVNGIGEWRALRDEGRLRS